MTLTQLYLTMRIWLRILRCIVTRTPMAPPPCGCRLGKGGKCGDVKWDPSFRRIRCYDCWFQWHAELAGERRAMGLSPRERRPMVWRVELRHRA